MARYNRRLIEDQLKKLISSKPDPDMIAAMIVPTSQARAAAAAQEPMWSEAIQRALEDRPEVKQQLINQRNNKIQMDYTRNQLRPMLDFTASYSQNGLGGNEILRDYSKGFLEAPIIGIQPGGFGQFPRFTVQRQATSAIPLDSACVSRSATIRRGSAMPRRKITYKQGEESLRSLRQQIALEVRQAYDALELNRASVEAAAGHRATTSRSGCRESRTSTCSVRARPSGLASPAGSSDRSERVAAGEDCLDHEPYCPRSGCG